MGLLDRNHCNFNCCRLFFLDFFYRRLDVFCCFCGVCSSFLFLLFLDFLRGFDPQETARGSSEAGVLYQVVHYLAPLSLFRSRGPTGAVC